MQINYQEDKAISQKTVRQQRKLSGTMNFNKISTADYWDMIIFWHAASPQHEVHLMLQPL